MYIHVGSKQKDKNRLFFEGVTPLNPFSPVSLKIFELLMQVDVVIYGHLVASDIKQVPTYMYQVNGVRAKYEKKSRKLSFSVIVSTCGTENCVLEMGDNVKLNMFLMQNN